ncbi:MULTISPECIES: ABC transporter permease [unclassified Streptomyces]|uniref:ABC transporter permease n=1 Tax=unclassified Streptomyces TaxID=2593676 RepID=UPI001C611473|nr:MULTISPECIES: iron chelate uptake ABC transporter family permease subunit [unclassified Streptomyces]
MKTGRLALRTGAVGVLLALTTASLLVGGYDITIGNLFSDPAAREMFFISRVPRTLALILAGVAMSVSGLIMQMITQNRFVEPTTTGTAQWAGLGILVTLIIAPNTPPLTKMVVASVFAMTGSLVFLWVLRRVALKSSLIVPLIGIMLGAVVSAVTVYLAASFNLLQSMSAWRSGGFSGIVRGHYEPLWVVGAITVAVFFLADRLTVAGLGRDVARSVGINYERVIFVATLLVAVATGVTSVVVGFLPFLGLIVPNIVSLVRGDNVRGNLPWVAALGAALILLCDLIGRTVVAPMEIPVSVVLGAIGAAVFIALVLRQRRHAAF